MSGLGPSRRIHKDPRLNGNRGRRGEFCVPEKLSRCKPPLKIQNPTFQFDLDIDCKIETYKVAKHVTAQRPIEESNPHSLLLFWEGS